MGSHSKYLIIIFHFVIGSSMIPGGYFTNSRFREYREIENVIKSYSLDACKEEQFNSFKPTYPSYGVNENMYWQRTGNKDASNPERMIYKERMTAKHTGKKRYCNIRRIAIYDVSGNIATARLTTDCGVEYLHLIKIEDEWSIFNVL